MKKHLWKNKEYYGINYFLKVAYCDRLGLKESFLSALLYKFNSLQP